MSMLAIKGHATRGREVIELLKMLGGINKKYRINFTEENLLYTIREGDDAIIATYPNTSINKIFTLEEFLEKFPYKIGDEVLNIQGTVMPCQIKGMYWDNDCVKYYCEGTIRKGECFDGTAEQLLPYKEETMDKANKAVFDANAQCCDIMNHLIKEKAMEEIKVDIPKGYEFAGVDEDKQQVVFTKIHPQYPKTYVECAKILNCFGAAHIDGYRCELLEKFQELLICRDAYWKIAGEQMGLGKPWKPDYKDGCIKYIITVAENEIYTDVSYLFNYILIFPTEEMRDTFLKNFKDLIEECKKLL